jgi:hypothetical protein
MANKLNSAGNINNVELFPTITKEIMDNGTNSQHTDYLNKVYYYLKSNNAIVSQEDFETFIINMNKSVAKHSIHINDIFFDEICILLKSITINPLLIRKCLEVAGKIRSVDLVKKYYSFACPELFLIWINENNISFKEKTVVRKYYADYCTVISESSDKIMIQILEKYEYENNGIYDPKFYDDLLDESCRDHKPELIRFFLNHKIVPSIKHFKLLLAKISKEHKDLELKISKKMNKRMTIHYTRHYEDEINEQKGLINKCFNVLVLYGYKVTYDDVLEAMNYKLALDDADNMVTLDEKYAELALKLDFFPYNFHITYTLDYLHKVCLADDEKNIIKVLNSGLKPDAKSLELLVSSSSKKTSIKLLIKNGAIIDVASRIAIIKRFGLPYFNRLLEMTKPKEPKESKKKEKKKVIVKAKVKKDNKKKVKDDGENEDKDKIDLEVASADESNSSDDEFKEPQTKELSSEN